MAYDLETPLKLPAGSKLVVTAHYDNSVNNELLMHHHGNKDSDPAHNPGPDKEVHFRDQNQSWDEMFSPFIQYSVDSEDPTHPVRTAQPQKGTSGKTDAAQTPEEESRKGGLHIVALVGCLEQSAPGTWRLTHASDPVVSRTQATSMAELKEEAARPLGMQQFELLGIRFFNPTSHKGEKIAVKGVLIKDTNLNRVNVTSLQTLASTCN